MAATTIKVSSKTRDRVKALSATEHRTADQIVADALDALDLARLRRQAHKDAERLVNDPADRAEMRRVMDDMEGLRAW